MHFELCIALTQCLRSVILQLDAMSLEARVSALSSTHSACRCFLEKVEALEMKKIRLDIERFVGKKCVVRADVKGLV